MKDFSHVQVCTKIISILSVASSFGESHATGLYPLALPLLNHALDSNNEENAFLVADSLNLWLTLLRLSMYYDSNFNVIFGRIEDLLRLDLEHIK
jgi:hypothetical protein